MTEPTSNLATSRFGTIFVLSGPSGAGKTTLCNQLLSAMSDMEISVSYTTRPPRAGELRGRDYHFVEAGLFDRMRRDGEFAEWAKVHGQLYGTPRLALEECIEQGRDVLLEIDVQGAMSIRKAFGGAVLIFIVPPSLEELRRRLVARGTDKADTIRQRMVDAEPELREMQNYDYAVPNRDVAEAVVKLKAIVTAERLRICKFRKRQL